jgi:RHH-type proline utilization regulon transcriptional repressor/proline dehydrogenase/delta 1-pyrroline-5-carboxylate dehydrogenase
MLPFRPEYAPDDTTLARALLAAAPLTPDREARVDAEARHMIGAIRGRSGGIGGVEQLLREYSLTTPEGLALMVLAEGLLRVPDDATADRLIEDKLGQGGFATHSHQSDGVLINASAWALGLSARLIGPQDTPEGILRGVVRRLGLPTVRGALRQALRAAGRGGCFAIVSICWARGRARPRMPSGIR